MEEDRISRHSVQPANPRRTDGNERYASIPIVRHDLHYTELILSIARVPSRKVVRALATAAPRAVEAVGSSYFQQAAQMGVAARQGEKLSSRQTGIWGRERASCSSCASDE